MALVSAYDFFHEILTEQPSFPEWLIVDSGGYESSVERELSDVSAHDHKPARWTVNDYFGTLDSWNIDRPTVFVTYDHPKHRQSTKKQVLSAASMIDRFPNASIELLIKPETKGQKYIQLLPTLSSLANIGTICAVGFTEKELGNSTFERMRSIAKIRKRLDNLGANVPIHIFGCLDPVTTPLYFLSGADLFDGLTWLRYGLSSQFAVYRVNYGNLKFGTKLTDRQLAPRIWVENLYQLTELANRMKRFLRKGHFSVFNEHEVFFREQIELLDAEVGGVL